MEKEIARCEECGSEYYAGSSLMKNICPECAHVLYGYTNCAHVFENGRCRMCYWDGSKSKFTEKLSEPEKPAVQDMPVKQAYLQMQAGKFKEALKILNDPVKTDQNSAVANLLILLCSYQVKTTEEILAKATASLAAFRVFTRRPELDRLTTILSDEENNLAEDMMEYSLLQLMLEGNTLYDIAQQVYSPKLTNHPRQESAFSRMDREDVHNFKREKALRQRREEYEFDPIEELDDIRVKFKSTLDHPDKDAVDVLSAGAHLVLDMITFFDRADIYYSSDSNRNYTRRHRVLREHDYGVNTPRKQVKSEREIYSDGEPVPEIESISDEGIPETNEGKIARQLELIELINEEEKAILSQLI